MISKIQSEPLPPMVFCHSICPSSFSFKIQKSSSPLEFSVLSPDIFDHELPATIYPPSCDGNAIGRESRSLPPIVFSHSISPRLLSLIIQKSFSPFEFSDLSPEIFD